MFSSPQYYSFMTIFGEDLFIGVFIGGFIENHKGNNIIPL